jgi:RimJ/RimL family protein N-acetyltransferase
MERAMAGDIELRDATEIDVPIFFEIQLDPVANYMVAFTVKDPADRSAYDEKWSKILSDDTIIKKTILVDGRVAGSVLSFVAPWSAKREVAYWIGRQFWGRGIATKALSQLLNCEKTRPLYARAAADNVGSIRVLEKCGFLITGCEKAFANARGEEIDEAVLELRG